MFFKDAALYCPWLVLCSQVIPAALQGPLAATWLTVYRQLQMLGKPTFGLNVIVILLLDCALALHAVL